MRKIFGILFIAFICSFTGKEAGLYLSWAKGTKVVLKPCGNALMTDSIQFAIDFCAAKGGGKVILSDGIYYTGTLFLRNKVILHLSKGAVLTGSDKYSDYKEDALIFGKELSEFGISGEGAIDGQDCYNPSGEEGFRGPHCIRLIQCKNFKIKGIGIRNAGNYAINCRHCSHATIENVLIRGGHDGLHTRFCDHFNIMDCDFRTGDDSFAGNDNKDFYIQRCKINSSCNGFRLGCFNLTVKHCIIWGPGEYKHKIQQRNNMLSAFVHFSPPDENPQLYSGNWNIEDILIYNVDHFYIYNFNEGLWQNGKPVTRVNFKRVKAYGILSCVNVSGDSTRLFRLSVSQSYFLFRKPHEGIHRFEGICVGYPALVNALLFNKLVFDNVCFRGNEISPFLFASNGNSLVLKNVGFFIDSAQQPYRFENIPKVKIRKTYKVTQ